MKVLITGGAGQLGSYLAFELSKISWIELLVSNKTILDITDLKQVNVYFEKHLPDVVINAAAFTSVDDAEKMHLEAFSVNHKGAANLAKSSAKYRCVMVHLSTDYVFDGNSDRPYVEDDLPHPLNTYGASKLNGETAVAHHNSKHIILRTSWLFSDFGKNFYLTMRGLLNTKKSISVVNDQIGAPTFVPDLVCIIINILDKLHRQKTLDWGIYHYAGYPFTSWFDFTKEIQKAVHPEGVGCGVLAVSAKLYDSLAKRPSYSCLNSSKTCGYFSVKPSDWIKRVHELAARAKSV